MNKIEFNNGFITAIALFLEHRDNHFGMKRNMSDLRMYAAADHLCDIEIPKRLSLKLKNRIEKWKQKCWSVRLCSSDENALKVNDKLFEEAENIMKAIDEEIFKTKKVIMRYR